MMATARWVTTINEDGNGATGDEVDDDGNDDDCGDGRRQGRWRRRDVIRPIATGNDNNDVNGDSATGNEVDDDGDSATGDDNDNVNDENGDHDSDGDGDGNGGMGSKATGYDGDADDDGDGRDDNDVATTMATAHQAGYYAHFILNWKKMFDTMATGDDDDEDNRRWTTRMATARRASKLRMMATMTTVATGDDDDGATDDGAMAYKDADDGDGRQRRWRQATTVMAMVDDDNNIISDSATGNEVGDDGDGVTGDDNDKDDTSCEATTNRRRLLWVATARFIVFNVSPSGESSHSFRCCAVSAMICRRVGIVVRIDSSPGEYCSMYSFITYRNN